MDVANYALAHYLARTGRAVSLVAHRVDADLAALPGVSFEKVSKPLNSYLLAAPLLRRRGLAVLFTLASSPSFNLTIKP